MKKQLYSKLAWMGIRKNNRLYTPYILTCIGMVMMYYIVSFLTVSKTVASVYGGETMQSMLSMGVGVLRIFIVIFLFYTNSFLIRRRKREFGLYNILGMGKKHLALVLTWESVMIAGISMAAGLFCGILFSKLAELAMLYVLQGEALMGFSVPFSVIGETAGFFAFVFVLLFLNTLRQVRLANPIELLRSENAGEKPPKGNWLFALAGVIILAGAYYLAIRIEHPIEAMVWFFVAVAMVIVGTYLLFISGSVVLCRILQKNKKYYYKTNHFISVSSMTYRMKRNGAGLASICILCTIVLVMVSSTVCLYIGIEETLRNRYPRNLMVDVTAADMDSFYSDLSERIHQTTEEVLEANQVQKEDVMEYRIATFAAHQAGEGQMLTSQPQLNVGVEVLSDIWQIMIVGLEDYNHLMHQEETLGKDEVMIATTKFDYEDDTICFEGKKTYQIKKQVEFISNGVDAAQIMPTMFLFVPDIPSFVEESQLNELLTMDGSGQVMGLNYYYGFDMDVSEEVQRTVAAGIRDGIAQLKEASGDTIFTRYYLESIAEQRTSFYALYGGLFFLGILLGIVFIFAAVLIIYYKQISEGYEDQSRFEIMQKVGVSKREIRKSINSQILTVFFLPLLTAGIHLGFAFPMISRLLLLLGMYNTKLFICVTLICYLIFAVCYCFVYRATSRAYYTIVSGKKGRE